MIKVGDRVSWSPGGMPKLGRASGRVLEVHGPVVRLLEDAPGGYVWAFASEVQREHG